MRKIVLSFLAGCLLPLCFAPFDSYSFSSGWLIFPLIAFFFYQIIHSNSIKQAFLLSWLFGLGFFLVGISWVYVAIHVFGSTPWWLAAFFTLLFVSTLALFYGLQGAASFYAMQHWFAWQSNPRKLLLFILPLNWLIFEWLRSWVLSGLPWLLAGYSQLLTPLNGYAPVLGIYGLTLMVVTIAASLLLLRRHKVLLPLIIIATFVSGHYMSNIEWTKAQGDKIRVTIVQGNSPQQTRWDQNYLTDIMRRYESLSLQWWDKTDVLIWPENAIPIFYHRIKDSFYKRLQQKINKYDITFVTGLPVQEPDSGKYYNALLKQEKQSQQFYFKQHLVPFGEYLPLENFLRGLIRFFNIPMSGFSIPEQQQEVIRFKGTPVATTICYEDIFPSLALQNLPNARLLLNLSNNGWYGDSLAPHQHLQIAQMRALENGRELIRSTTSGISALIDHRGKITARTAQFESAILNGQVQPRIGYTPYTRYANLPLLSYAIFLILFLYITAKKQTERTKTSSLIVKG